MYSHNSSPETTIKVFFFLTRISSDRSTSFCTRVTVSSIIVEIWTFIFCFSWTDGKPQTQSSGGERQTREWCEEQNEFGGGCWLFEGYTIYHPTEVEATQDEDEILYVNLFWM